MASYSYGSESTTLISNSSNASNWTGAWTFAAINAIAKANIPAYAAITAFTFTVYAKEQGGTFNSDIDIFFANSSNGSVKSLYSNDNCVYDSGYSSYALDLKSNVQSDNTSAGQITYSSADRICVKLEKTTSIGTNRKWQCYYVAKWEYTIPTCTATFKNYDGTTLKTVTVNKGSTPSYTGSTPTRPSTAEYTYTFSGWSPTIGPITANTVYTAQFTATKRKYTVRWYNEDGTLLETDTTQYGVMPTYDGATPTKAATAEFTYTFKGWHIEVATVTGNIDYYARFTETTNKYTVLWKNYDGSVLETDTTEYGAIPTYDGNTPTKPGTVQYSYSFLGWDTTVEEVTRDVVYTAVFTETVNKYTLTVLAGEGGTVTGGGTYDYGSTVTLTAEPLSGYKFARWSDGDTSASRTVTITGNAAYTAMFELDSVSQMLADFSEVYEIYADEKTVYEVYVDENKIFG